MSLYMAQYNLSFKVAVQELGKHLGLDRKAEKEVNKKPKLQVQANTLLLKPKETPEEEKLRKIKGALALYQRAIPIPGTVAEQYLREHRGIAGELPKDFRFLKADKHFHTKKHIPALVAPYRDKDHKIVGVVRIYLNPDGSQYRDTFQDTRGRQVEAGAKLNKGISSFGGVVIQEAVVPHTVWIAEGIETALSVAQALSHQTVVASVAAQQIANTPISPETQKVVICADNDPVSSNTKESIIKAVDSFLAQGLKVFIALPPGIPAGMKKYDFNDLLKDQGVLAVQTCLEQMLEIKDANLLRTSEARLETDLSKIRLENKQERSDPQHLAKEPLITHQPSPVMRLEKMLEKGMER